MVHIFRSLAGLASLLLGVNCVWAWLSIDNSVATTDSLHQLQALHTEIKELQWSTEQADPQNRAVGIQKLESEEAELVEQLKIALRQSDSHFLFLVATALVAMLVCSITITYFIGTSRWCKEVIEAYALDTELAAKSTVYKRQAFPWALTGIVAVLLLAALGGAANPNVRLTTEILRWNIVYGIAGIALTLLVGICFWKQSHFLTKNHVVIQSILNRVQQIRNQRELNRLTQSSFSQDEAQSQ